MSHVLQCVESLSKAIVESDEYITYTKAKEAIKGNTELINTLKEYRMESLNLQNKSNIDEYFAELDCFEQKYNQFKKDPKVMDFLVAELRLCRMIQEINITIVKFVDLEF